MWVFTLTSCIPNLEFDDTVLESAFYGVSMERSDVGTIGSLLNVLWVRNAAPMVGLVLSLKSFCKD